MRYIASLCLTSLSGAVAADVTPKRLAALHAKPSPFENVSRDRYVAESENAFAIRDEYPQAPVYILSIPKKRVPTVIQAPPALVAEMVTLAKQAAKQEGIENNGFGSSPPIQKLDKACITFTSTYLAEDPWSGHRANHP